jgi:hypothetical protein
MSKVKITLVVFMSFLMLTASARKYRSSYDGMLREGFHMGVQGSINSVWILNQNNYNTLDLFYVPIVRQSEMDYVFTWGGQVGVDIGYNFKKKWGIDFQPAFSWAGQTYDDDFSGPVAAIPDPTHVGQFLPDPNVKNAALYFRGDYTYVNVRREVKFNYIQFPVYARFQTHIGDIANFYVMLGPQLNYRSSASENVWVNHAAYVNPNNFTPDQKFQKLDIGVGLQTGIDIYATEWCYFNIGITSFIAVNDLNGNVLKSLDWYSKNDLDYQSSRNFYIGLHAGVHFYLDKQHYY